jgi:hypothetical protein
VFLDTGRGVEKACSAIEEAASHGARPIAFPEAFVWDKKEKMMSRAPQTVLIAGGQILAAGEVLARAFFNDPLCVYTQPDLEARMSQFTWLFSQIIREGARQGGVYTNALIGRPDGVAVWVPPRAGGPTAEAAVGARWIRWGSVLGLKHVAVSPKRIAILSTSITSVWRAHTGTWRCSVFPPAVRARV